MSGAEEVEFGQRALGHVRAAAWLTRFTIAALGIRGLNGGEGHRSTSSVAPAGSNGATDAGLISSAYQDQNRELHESAGYGVTARYHLHELRILSRLFSRDILDYGCGKRLLEAGLGFPISNYDPGIPGLDGVPAPADVVACLGVLEHIEPDRLDTVLTDLARVTRRVGYLLIGTAPASKNLPDGRNAHLIVQSPAWWQRRLSEDFSVRLRRDASDRVTILVAPLSSG